MSLASNKHIQFLPHAVIREVIANLERNDPAHREDHVECVVNYAAEIADKRNLNEKDRRVLLTAAFMHDIACHISRENHHELGAVMAASILRRWTRSTHENFDSTNTQHYFHYDELAIITEAIAQHRGSFKGERTHPLCELMRVADAGKLNVETFGDRAILYRVPIADKGELPWDALLMDAAEHLIDKWGEKGYNWNKYPMVGQILNADEIVKIKEMCGDRLNLIAHLAKRCQLILAERESLKKYFDDK